MTMLALQKNAFRKLLHQYFRIKHSLRCVPNIVDCDCDEFQLDKHTLLPFKSTKAVYFYIDDHAPTKKDPGVELVLAKSKLNFNLAKTKSNYTFAMKNIKYKKARKMRAEQGFVCRDFVMMVRHLESDPDEYFQGAYNWYFTGGCLDVAEMDGYHFVFHASGDDMRILNTSRYNGSSALNTEQPNSKMQFKSSIKEVQYDRGHLILRCKSYVYLYNFDPVSVAFELLIRCKGEAPFICARLSNDQSEMICLDLDHILRVIPLKKKGSAKTREMSLAEYFEGEENKWGQFVTLSSSDNLCLVATRSKLLLVDLVKMECRGCTDIKKMDLVVPCSSIGGVWKSDLCEITDSELIYLTTTHEVFAIKLLLDDVTKSWKGGKSLKKCVPFKVCIRWTHQFKSDPLVLKSTCLDETKEMLYLSSLVNNSTRVLLVEWSACALSKHKQVNGEDNEPQEEDESEEEPEPEPILSLHSYHPPFKPTDLATSHNTCLERGLLLETEYDMRTQINMSTVGLGIFQGNGMGGSITLLTMNSQGDIYHQKLTSTTKREEEDGEEGESNRGEEKEGVFMEEMRRAQRTLMDRDKDDTLAVTETKNARSLFFDVIGPNDESECTKAEEKERRDRLKKMKRKWNWNRPIGKLKRYKDVLSQDLLDVWDVSESEGEAEMDEDDEDVRLSRFMAPADKVNFWLQSHQSPAVVGAAAVEQEEEKPETALDWTVDDDVFCSTQRDGQEAAIEDTEVYLDLSGGPDKPTQKREVKKKTKRASGF